MATRFSSLDGGTVEALRRGGGQLAGRVDRGEWVGLCTESFCDPADASILLVMGVAGSMLWWEEGFCRMLLDGGRLVFRHDHRDTGRSVTYDVGSPGTRVPTWSPCRESARARGSASGSPVSARAST